VALGNLEEALRQTRAALAQDPLNPRNFWDLGDTQTRRGRLTEAEAAFRRALTIRPTFPWAHFSIGFAKLARGDRDGALLEMQQETTDYGQQMGLTLVYHALGRNAESDAVLEGMLKEQSEGNAFGIAEMYAFRGQSDEAMHWLERAYVQKDPFLFYVKGDPPLKTLEADPRFKAFLRKMNLPE
jgi:tetratricopeptide (TPR) repeat protein